MFKFCELCTVILWYELNPRVRCAFGNVLVISRIQQLIDEKLVCRQGQWLTIIDSKLFADEDNCVECDEAIEGLEKIDDETDALDITMVKVNDAR